MWNLTFITEEDFTNHVKATIEKYGEKLESFNLKRFNKNIGTDYVYKAGKPSGRGYMKGVKMMGIRPEEAVFIGDQLFTDIYGANRAGIDCICVKPIAKHEEIQIVLKRKLEKIVYAFYRRHKRKEN